MMPQDAAPGSAGYKGKTPMIVALLLGFSLGALLSLPASRYATDGAIAMAAAPLAHRVQPLQFPRAPATSPLSGNKYAGLSHLAPLPARFDEALLQSPQERGSSVVSFVDRGKPNWERMLRRGPKVHKQRHYEILLILRTDSSEQDHIRLLAKIQAQLNAEGAEAVKIYSMGQRRLAYPIQGRWEGAVFTIVFEGLATVSQAIKKFLATPDLETQGQVLRWESFRTDKYAAQRELLKQSA